IAAGLGQHPALADEPGKAACRERAPAEAEEVDVVVRLEVVGDEAVAVLDVLRETSAECAAGQLRDQPPLRADAGVVVDDLRHAVAAGREDGLREERDVVAGAAVAGIPGTVTADDNPLHRRCRLSPAAAVYPAPGAGFSP